MNHSQRTLADLVFYAMTVVGTLLVSQSVQAQCVTDEMKAKWRDGQYQQVVRPLMNCVDAEMNDDNFLELKYMLAKTWCNLARQKAYGCEAYRNIRLENGNKITVAGQTIDLRNDHCCPSEENTALVGVDAKFDGRTRPFHIIANAVERDMHNNVSHAARASWIRNNRSTAVRATRIVPKVDGTWRYTMLSEQGGGTHEGSVNFTSDGTSVTGVIDVWDNTGKVIRGTIEDNFLDLSRETGLDTVQHYQFSLINGVWQGRFWNTGKYADSGSIVLRR